MMNALKIADDLWVLGYKKAADAIRQQHAEIVYLQEMFDKAIDFMTKANSQTTKVGGNRETR